ncbi:methyltransferase domain-containing protein [bacterium]|nr:methyltransferase domain-containing protein [bacterium]
MLTRRALCLLAGSAAVAAHQAAGGDPPPDAFAEAFAAALDAPDRPYEHRARDGGREAETIFRMANLRPGGRVLDVAAGGGYLTLIASALVGEGGEVVLQNSPHWIHQLPGLEEGLLRQRIGRANVAIVTAPFDAIPGEDGAFDAILFGQAYHDMPLEPVNRAAMNSGFARLLKPGGRLVISDHDTRTGIGAREAGLKHRIEKALVIEEVTAAGLSLVDELEIDMPDTRILSVFNPAVRGRTDRYVLAFERALEG